MCVVGVSWGCPCPVVPVPVGLSSPVEGPHLFCGTAWHGVSLLNVFLKSQCGEHKRPEFVTYLGLHIRPKTFLREDGDGNYTLFQPL
ncbi:Cytochrome c oxidase subunit 6A1, mitochondrial [Lemmus lemmus]